MMRFKLSFAIVALSGVALLGTTSSAQAQLNLGYNPGFGGLTTYNYGTNVGGFGGVRNAGFGFQRPSSLYGGVGPGNNFAGYGTPYNYYLANRAYLTPNVYNSALPFGAYNGFGGFQRNFSQYQFNVTPFGGLNYRYRYGRFFGR